MELLPPFIKFLEAERLLDFSDFRFATRLKIQKYVYLSKQFGLDLGYEYSIYRYGPYSPILADAYYELAENPKSWLNDDTALPNCFDREGFVRLVGGKSNGWLEVAATLVDLRDRFADDKALVTHVESIKCNYSIDFINAVLHDLQAQHML